MPCAWEYPQAILYVNHGGYVFTPHNPYSAPTLVHTRCNLTFQLQDCRCVSSTKQYLYSYNGSICEFDKENSHKLCSSAELLSLFKLIVLFLWDAYCVILSLIALISLISSSSRQLVSAENL